MARPVQGKSLGMPRVEERLDEDRQQRATDDAGHQPAAAADGQHQQEVELVIADPHAARIDLLGLPRLKVDLVHLRLLQGRRRLLHLLLQGVTLARLELQRGLLQGRPGCLLGSQHRHRCRGGCCCR
eukprot:scaffold2479_cov42-Phaeocystis_antarctica.AAC.1